MNKGYYIVIEGPQGVGKSTQVKLLERALNNLKIPVKVFKEPDNNANITTKLIHLITQDPTYPLNTKAETLLYNASRALSLDKIQSYVNKGYICISDRNYLSTLAVQYYSSDTPQNYNTLLNIINYAVGNNEPNYTIILDAPAQIMQDRQKARNEHDRFDDLSLSKLDKIRAGYLIEAKNRNIPVVVSIDKPLTVHKNIWNLTRNVLNNNYTKQIGLFSSIKPNATDANDIKITNIKISGLLLSQIAKDIKYSVIKNSNNYDYVIPDGLSKKAKSVYIQSLGKISQLNKVIKQKITENNDISQLSEPLSRQYNINISGITANYKTVLKTLINTNTQEATVIYNVIKQELLKYSLHEFSDEYFYQLNKQSALFLKNNVSVNAKINELAISSYSNALKPVNLYSYNPKNEINLLKDIIYSKSELSLQEISNNILKKQYKQKANLLSEYIKNNNFTYLPASYSWELITSYKNYLNICTTNKSLISNQILTPRYGYDIPDIIEKSGVIDEYLQCFDTSLELHSYFIANNVSEYNAQYACLLGHKIRFYVSLNLEQTIKLISNLKNSHSLGLINIAKDMTIKLSEIHPILSEALSIDYK